MTNRIILIFVFLNLVLNIYGNNWGLPSRWHSDEKVANSLHMLHEKSLVDKRGYFYQPTGYQIILAIWLVPYLALLKLSGFSFDELGETASVSWSYMAQRFPDFATTIYIYSRGLSAILGALTVYLIFLLTSRIYDRKSGFFSAAFLSVCMVFVGINHFAKYSSALNFLMTLALLLSIFALEKNVISEAKKLFYLSVFFLGIAASVKFSAIFLLLPLSLVYCFKFIDYERGKKINNSIKSLFLAAFNSAIIFVFGFILLTPSILFHFKDYFAKETLGSIISGTFIESTSYPFYSGAINNLVELAVEIGIPIFILILIGMIGLIRRLFSGGISKGEIVILSFVIPYWIIMTVLSKDIYPQAKIIILVVPLLTVFAGKAMSDIFDFKKLNYAFKLLIFLLIFSYSLAYTYSADLVFLKGDTRYASTKWIKENIPVGSKIEIFSQLHLVCEDKILNDYEIIFLGQSSKKFKGGTLPRWINIEGREKYIEQLNKNGSTADYIIVNLNYLEKLYSEDFLGYLPGLASYVKEVFKGKRNFVLVKTFAPKNRKIVFNKTANLISPENIFWEPIPDYESVSPTIYIFKKDERLYHAENPVK